MLKLNLQNSRNYPFEWVTELAVNSNPDLWCAKAHFKSDGKGSTEICQIAECGENDMLQNGELPLAWTPKTNRVFFLN